MYSDATRKTVRRNARAGLTVPMGAQAQRGLYQSQRVPMNVQRLNQSRRINSFSPVSQFGAMGQLQLPDLGALAGQQQQIPQQPWGAPSMGLGQPEGGPPGLGGQLPPGLMGQLPPGLMGAPGQQQARSPLAQLGALLMRGQQQ